MRLKHVALHVPELEQAEAFYSAVFDMAVVTREALGEDGVWRQVPHVGVVAGEREIAQVRRKLPDGSSVEVDAPTALTFVDPWGWRWQLSGSGFRGSGEIRGDWLALER